MKWSVARIGVRLTMDTLFLLLPLCAFQQHTDSNTQSSTNEYVFHYRQMLGGSTQQLSNSWLTEAKNVFVDWALNFIHISIFADFSKAFDTLKRVAGIFVFSAWLTWSMSCNHAIMRKTGYEGLQHGEKHQQDSSSWQRCFSCSNRRSCQCIFKHSVSFSKSQVRCKHWNYWIHFPAKTIIVATTKLVL